jgi:hypothetical protein
MNDLILYTTDDGKSRIQLRADLGTVWLTQLEMAELFQTTKQNIAKHLKAIFAEQELVQDSAVNQRLITAADGKNHRVAHYNLDASISANLTQKPSVVKVNALTLIWRLFRLKMDATNRFLCLRLYPIIPLILYTTRDGRSQIGRRVQERIVCLTQLEMAELFDATKQNASSYVKSLFADKGLGATAVIKKSLATCLRSGFEATVKQSLTVQVEPGRRSTTEKSSVVHKDRT